MPQASDELRAEMQRLFNDSIGDSGPTKFLENAGYRLGRDWQWEPKPGVSGLKDMAQDEWLCLLFLVHEWDYGGLKIDSAK